MAKSIFRGEIMQYYQKAAEAQRSGDEYPLQILKNAGLTALGGGAASAGSKAISSLLPTIGALINEYVPDKLSQTGLSKVDPRFNKFIQGALSEGYSYDDVRSFLGDKIKNSQTKENRNIIEQYDPELHTYITQKMKKGKTHIEAGQKALGHGRFKRAIDKLTKDHKIPWTSILESVYGSQMAPKKEEQPQSEQQPQGQGSSSLLSILQKLQSARGAQ